MDDRFDELRQCGRGGCIRCSKLHFRELELVLKVEGGGDERRGRLKSQSFFSPEPRD